MSFRSTVLALAVALAGFPAIAAAQSTPDSENGRYTFTAIADGVLRLDTRTGQLASCHNRIAGWSCYAVPDERAALDTEIGKLQGENIGLKSELARFKDEQARLEREIAALKQAHQRLDAQHKELKAEIDRLAASSPPPKIDAPLAREEPADKGAARHAGKGNRLELPLPDDHEIERAVSFVERAWRRLIEMAGRVQRDVSGKI